MIYVFVGLSILVVSFVVALISLIRDSSRMQSIARRQADQSANPSSDADSTTADTAAAETDAEQPLTVEEEKPQVQDQVRTETVPFPWEEKQPSFDGDADLEKNEDVLPWEAPQASEATDKVSGLGGLKGEVSLKDLKKD